MKNPFLVNSSDGNVYVDKECSLNKMVIARVPVRGIDDSVEGKAVSQIFSSSVIVDEIMLNRERLKISEDIERKKLPFMLMECFNSKDEQVYECAREIAIKFGKRLGLILLTLKTGLPENKAVRQCWNDSHWEYWKSIESIIAVGGLTSGEFGKELVRVAEKVCIVNGKPAYKIIIFENAYNTGVIGCARLLNNPNGINLLMDFGQTNMKRSIVKRENFEIVSIENLPIVPSRYMDWDIEDAEEKHRQAVLLHRHIMQAVVDAYCNAERKGKVNPEIVISIASYTHNGVLDENRGGYAKLCVLYKNYGEYLSEELSSVLKTQVNVTLVHDGTAVALCFADYKNSVCVTLGTFVGVGFPDMLSND